MCWYLRWLQWLIFPFFSVLIAHFSFLYVRHGFHHTCLHLFYSLQCVLLTRPALSVLLLPLTCLEVDIPRRLVSRDSSPGCQNFRTYSKCIACASRPDVPAILYYRAVLVKLSVPSWPSSEQSRKITKLQVCHTTKMPHVGQSTSNSVGHMIPN